MFYGFHVTQFSHWFHLFALQVSPSHARLATPQNLVLASGAQLEMTLADAFNQSRDRSVVRTIFRSIGLAEWGIPFIKLGWTRVKKEHLDSGPEEGGRRGLLEPLGGR
jgi:hypothetical protein